MKIQKSILMVILLGLVFTLTSNASDSKAAHEAEYELKYTISSLFKKVPWEDIVEPSGNCIVTISFSVNDDLTLNELQVEGENEDLVHFTKVVLERNKVHADKVLVGKKYQMQIRFKNEA